MKLQIRDYLIILLILVLGLNGFLMLNVLNEAKAVASSASNIATEVKSCIDVRDKVITKTKNLIGRTSVEKLLNKQLTNNSVVP